MKKNREPRPSRGSLGRLIDVMGNKASCRQSTCPVGNRNCRVSDMAVSLNLSVDALVPHLTEPGVQRNLRKKHCLPRIRERPGWGNAGIVEGTDIIIRHSLNPKYNSGISELQDFFKNTK